MVLSKKILWVEQRKKIMVVKRNIDGEQRKYYFRLQKNKGKIDDDILGVDQKKY